MDVPIASNKEPAMKTRTKLLSLGVAAALAAGVGTYAYTASAAGFGPFAHGWTGMGPGMMGPNGYGPGMMGPRGYGPGAGPFTSGLQVDATKAAAAAKEQLSKATVGENWTAPNGSKLTPILVDNQIVGRLWQSADLTTLEIGSYWQGRWGVNVQLLKNGEVVGMMWVKVS
jgi:hypothetical protein